jgi:hypothetical protein
MSAESTATMEAAEWSLLNERQQEQAEDYAELALKYGQFNQGTGADGAHYAPAEANPFVAEGLKCGNCIFFNEVSNQCQVVEGILEPEAVCKLWIIPESLLTKPAARATDWTYIKGAI